jgi:Family of unknown function (DUF6184)
MNPLKQRIVPRRALVFAVTCAGVVSACSHAPPVKSSTTTTTAASVGNDKAIARIVEARCDREDACNRIGDGKKWETSRSCRLEMEHDARASLAAERCPGGLDAAAVNTCVDKVRVQRCRDPIDAIEREVVCQKLRLCLR